MASKTIKEKEAELEAKKDVKKQEIIRFPTGIAVLDCMLSEGRGSTQMGYPTSMMMRLNSHSKAGKTRLALEAIYSMLLYYGKDNVEYLFIDAERGMSIDTDACYGFSLSEKDGTLDQSIETIDQMQVLVSEFCKKKDPKKKGIIVVDSLDALPDAEAFNKLEERTKQQKKDGKVDTIKSYGMTKAKLLREILSTCNGIVSTHNTHFLVIQQVTTNVNAGMFEKKDTTNGGTAPGFFTTVTLELKRKESYGPDKEHEIGYLLEVFGDKTRTKYERRKAYIAVDHEIGFDRVKSDLIFLYDLLTDIKKLDTTKASALKWYDKWDSSKADEQVEAITKDQYKEFVEKYDLDSMLVEQYGKRTLGNIKKMIRENPDIYENFVKDYNVFDLDSLCAWIEDNGLEEELRRRTIDKFYTIEEGLRPIERKRKRL